MAINHAPCRRLRVPLTQRTGRRPHRDNGPDETRHRGRTGGDHRQRGPPAHPGTQSSAGPGHHSLRLHGNPAPLDPSQEPQAAPLTHRPRHRETGQAARLPLTDCNPLHRRASPHRGPHASSPGDQHPGQLPPTPAVPHTHMPAHSNALAQAGGHRVPSPLCPLSRSP